MRFRLDLSFSFGKDDEQGRDSDHTGYLADAGQPIGFTRPEADDE